MTHETPELIWLKDYSNHPNLAEALTDLFIISDEHIDKANQYARFTYGSILEEDGLWVVELYRGRITFSSPNDAKKILPGLKIPSLPHIAALSIRSSNLRKTNQYFQSRGVSQISTNDNVICIGPEEGLGAYLVFHSRGIGTGSVWLHIGK